MKRFDTIAILDFGSQYTQLIARRIREEHVYSEILPHNIKARELARDGYKGIILSGSPASVSSGKSPICDKGIFSLGIPLLGICYGMQLMAKLLGGEVRKAGRREYGYARLNIKESPLFNSLPKRTQVWMSHGDEVKRLPRGFKVIGYTRNSPIASMEDKKDILYGVQFHPEVAHTPEGKRILRNFLFNICNAKAGWTMRSFVNDTVKKIRGEVGKDNRIILALSGGVDSSVLAVLLHKAVKDNLTCIFVNNGLLREGEPERVIDTFKRHYRINLRYVNAAKIFLNKLKDVTDPEKKRRIIGREFINIFEKESRKLGGVKFLAQGTLYPDLIESRSSFGGPSATIKTHHNVGGLPARMKLRLIEPFKYLFKDEIRLVGRELGLPDDIIYRQPFPGPGLAVRVIGKIAKESLNMLRKADRIVLDEIKNAGLYREIWQSFAVLLPVKTVGVMGDERTYENVVAIRAVKSLDGMTADWVRLPHELVARISNRIINEVKGVNRVVYDVSSKPPSTIEWE